MLLDKDIAIKIIQEIGKTIKYDINIMDENGRIIASTKPDRIDTYHEGAHLVISNNASELVVNYDNEYSGCLKGINLPIILNNKIIGVIGISGDVDKVSSYGKIMKKMTEILVEDLFTKEQHKQNEQSKLFFINEWILGNFKNNFFFFEQNAKQYDIDFNSQFTVALFKIMPQELDSALSFEVFDHIISFVTELLNDKGLLFACHSNANIIISQKYNSAELYEVLNSILGSIPDVYKTTYICGIGHTYANYQDVPKSYDEAKKIINFFYNNSPGIHLYDDNIISLMIDSIPMFYKNQCVLQAFKNCTKNEISDFSDFIITYYYCNGSINKIANKLYIHKNTVQYKIKKIYSKTGMDLRICNDLIILFFASNFSKSHDFDFQESNSTKKLQPSHRTDSEKKI